MANKTDIPWTEATLNPVSGCTPVDESCKNCYARAMIHRYAGCKGWPVHEDVVTLWPERLKQLAKWKTPKMIFMPSMGDLFHSKVPDWFLYQVFDAILATPQHIYQILTKRIDRVGQFLKQYSKYNVYLESKPMPRDRDKAIPLPLDNVWLGVSIGAGQKYADERMPILLSIPAAVRFVSVEPMLEKIDFGFYNHHPRYGEMLDSHLRHLDWVICGAESGPGRRPFNTEWARDLKNQCVDAGVPFFFKQGHDVNGKVVKMPELDGKVWDEMPNVNFFQHFLSSTSF